MKRKRKTRHGPRLWKEYGDLIIAVGIFSAMTLGVMKLRESGAVQPDMVQRKNSRSSASSP